jgi:hemerythrin-like metal-binding protein
MNEMREFDMTNFEWDESVALGIPRIDEQHKALFGWINTLNDSIVRGDGHETVEEIICNLITYVTEHFSEEERLMLACSYPQLVSHRSEHDNFVAKLQDIQTSFIAGNDMSASVHDFMVNWLVCHIKGTDQGYSRFIHEWENQ